MAEIDPLSANYYYTGVQNAANEKIKNNKAKEEVSKTRRSKFSDLLKAENEASSDFKANSLPSEIAELSLDDAVVYLKDAVDNAGNALAENVTRENIDNFKNKVRQFITFIVENNFEVKAKRKMRNGKVLMEPSRTNFFSNYALPPHQSTPKVKIEILNEKLDELTRETLSTQANNMKILAQIDEIKGLIVDLISS